MKNVIDTVAAQYANSPTLRRLIDNMNEYIDPAANFEDFYNLLWNIDTARGYGLDVWGKIVNVGRYLQIPSQEKYFGFDGAQGGGGGAIIAYLAPATSGGLPFFAPPTISVGGNSDIAGFDQQPFFVEFGETNTYRLEDEPYRTLILNKALANISNTSVPSINQLLRNLVGNRGRCYVREDGAMQIAYVFEFQLQPYERAILTQSNVIPKPAAVQVQIVELFADSTFGFKEQTGAQTFDNGVFFNP